jgi:hypothetical protein
LGKPESEYTNHVSRQMTKYGSVTICPEILKSECAHCHEYGHCASEDYCPVLKAAAFFDRERKRAAVTAATPKRSNVPVVNAAAATNVVKQGFAVLSMSDSESESESESNSESTHFKEEYPALVPGSRQVEGGDALGLCYKNAVLAQSTGVNAATAAAAADVKQVISGNGATTRCLRLMPMDESSVSFRFFHTSLPVLELSKRWNPSNPFVSNWASMMSDSEDEDD